MPTYNYPFSGGKDAVVGYGDRYNFLFAGTWINASPLENWSVLFTTGGLGDFTIGAGQLILPSTTFYFHGWGPTSAFTFRNRVYLAMGPQFNFSDNGDPTAYELQDPGAGFQPFLSQYGAQDIIAGFAVLQGRLAVIGRRSVQIWVTNGDPTQFTLEQVLDNIGTFAPLSIAQIGDYDALLLDDTGIRSLRSKEVTLNAYVDDIGSPIDNIIQNALSGLSTTTAAAACSAVDPTTKNYWLYLNGVIYVLSRRPAAKVIAWSTYEPKDSGGTTFVAQKFVVYNGTLYVRSAARQLYRYGGTNNSTYDSFSQVSFQTPFLNDKRPGVMKNFTALSATMQGKWTLSACTDPQSNTFVPIATLGSAASPNTLSDSTFDINRLPFDMQGTHISVKGVTLSTSTTEPCLFSSALLYYNLAGVE